MALKLRRGTDSQRALITPADGELIYTTDTKKLYIGDGSTAGGNRVDTAGTSLEANLSLNNYDLVGTGNINTTGNITVTGNITADGNLTLGGNLTVGDASTDTINLTSKVESHILPDVDSARNIGSSVLRWGQGHFGTLHVTDDLNAGSINANIIGDDSTVIINKATGALNASGTFKGDVKATDNSSFFNATSKAVNAGAGTFTGTVSAATIESENIVGNFKGTIVGDDSTILVDAVNSRVNLNNGTVSFVSDQIELTGTTFLKLGKTADASSPTLQLTNVDASKPIDVITKAGTGANDTSKFTFSALHGANPQSPAQATAGDWQGVLTGQSWDPTHNGGVYVPSSIIAFTVDGNETIAADTAKGKIEFITNAGTGSSPSLKSMSFDAAGKVKINGAPGDVAGANLDVVGTAQFTDTVKFANMTTVERNALASVSAGMVIYNTTDSKLQLRTGVAWVDLN